MHAFIKGKMLCRSECNPWGDQPFHCRIIGKVQVHGHIFENATLLKTLTKPFRLVMTYSHGRKDDRKAFIVCKESGLSDNLCRKLIVGKAAPGKDRQFLAPHQGVHPVNGGNPGLNKLLRVGPGHRVDGKTVHITSFPLTGNRATIKGLSQPAKDPAQYLFPGDHNLKRVAKKTDPGGALIKTRCPFKHLNDGKLVTDGEHPAVTRMTIRDNDFYLFVKTGSFNPLDNQQWSVDTFKTDILQDRTLGSVAAVLRFWISGLQKISPTLSP